MTQQLQTREAVGERVGTGGRSWLNRLVGAAGWLLIAFGTLIILYLIYSLFFTNLQTQEAQREIARRWETQIVPRRPVGDDGNRAAGGQEAGGPGTDRPARPQGSAPGTDRRERSRGGAATDGDPSAFEPAPAPSTGEPVAKVEFVRPGSSQPPVHAEPLYVVQGVGIEELQDGPGHYPGTSMPGADGNFAVAGHRTTYAAPFFHLDQLRRGDRVRVTDTRGRRFVYTVRTAEVVAPSDVWVIAPDPLETGAPTLTLTTCHPRFSAAERLVVFAELRQ